MWASLAAAAAPIVGGMIGANSQSKANKQNLKIAREQMAFQERMSSTAYQRAMDDMRKAGLNPILAGKVGGASTPAGSQATMQSEDTVLANALINSAMSVAQVEKTIAETQQIKQHTSIKKPIANAADSVDAFVEDMQKNIEIIKSPEVKRQIKRDFESLRNFLSEAATGAKDSIESTAQELVDAFKGMFEESKQIDQAIQKGKKSKDKSPLDILNSRRGKSRGNPSKSSKGRG